MAEASVSEPASEPALTDALLLAPELSGMACAVAWMARPTHQIEDPVPRRGVPHGALTAPGRLGFLSASY